MSKPTTTIHGDIESHVTPPLIVLTGEAVNTLNGVNRIDTKQADAHLVVLTHGFSEAHAVEQRLEQKLHIKAVKLTPFKIQEMTRVHDFVPVAYRATHRSKFEQMENAHVIDVNTINLPGNIKLLEKFFGANPLLFREGKAPSV